MAKTYANRVWMTTATAGTGTITLGSAKAGYLTFAEGGVANADTVTYVLIDGNDFEIGTGTYTSSGTTMSRDTVTVSKISGTAGTTKLTLSGSAEVFLANDQDETAFLDRENTFTAKQGIGTAPWGGATSGTLTLYGQPTGVADYNCIVLSGENVTNNSPKGGAITGARYANANEPFVIFCSYDAGSFRELYFGGGGWGVPDATRVTFWTATTYNETADQGVQRMQIASHGGVGIGADPISGTQLALGSEDAGASAGPLLDLFRDSASPAASDVIGQLKFTGRDSAANVQDYAAIDTVITDPTSTTEDGDLVFRVVAAGTLTERMRLTSEGALMAPQPEKAEVGTTYTLAASDSGKIVTLSNGSAITLTVPTNASVPIPVGTRIDIAQWGAGQVSITSSATVRSEGSKLKLRGQYAVATLWKRATDEWLLAGDIVA